MFGEEQQISDRENNKRIAKNTLLLYIRMALTMVVALYTSRVVLNTLGIEDFGIYNVVGGVVMMFSFLTGTLTSGTQRFLTFHLGKVNYRKLKKTFSASLFIHILLAFLILILAETVGLWFLNTQMNIQESRMYAAQWVYQFSVFASLLTVVQAPYNACIIAHERMGVYAYVSILDVSLKLLMVYLLVLVDVDKLILYSILIFIVNLLIMIVYLIYCRWKYVECSLILVKDKELYKSILTFSGWNIFGCLGYSFSDQGVNILLNIFFGPTINAARGIACQVGNALGSFVNNFQIAVNPQLVKLYANAEYERMNNLLCQNSKYAFCLLWFLALPVLLELNIILTLWLKIVPENAVLFCRIILVQSLLYSIDRPFVMAVHATGNMKQTSIVVGSLLLLILPISYLLLKIGLPSYTPFVLSAIVIPLCFIVELYYLKKWIGVSFVKVLKKVFVPITKIVIVSSIVPLLVFVFLESTLLRFGLVLLTSIISVTTSFYYIGLNIEMRKLVISKAIKMMRLKY